MRRQNSQSGFTLLELMIVLAIISAMAILAFGSIQSQLPSQRLNAGTRDMLSAMQQARARAVRAGRPVKLCIFRQASTNFKNQYLTVMCNNGQVCADPVADLAVCADDANGVDDTKVGASPKRWALPSTMVLPVGAGNYTDIAGSFSTSDYGAKTSPTVVPEVEIFEFRNAAGTAITTNFIEIAFTSSGTVNPALSTKDGGSPAVMVTRMRMRSTAPALLNGYRDLRWTVGGGVRITR